jgi:hypothetical protein
MSLLRDAEQDDPFIHFNNVATNFLLPDLLVVSLCMLSLQYFAIQQVYDLASFEQRPGDMG